MNIQNLNIDLATDKTTTSTTFVTMSGSSIAFTPTKPNCEITVDNLDLRHSGSSQIQARVRCNQGTLEEETIAVMSGSTAKTMSASAKYSAMPIGVSSTIRLEWKVTTGGTATAESDTWLNIQIIEYD